MSRRKKEWGDGLVGQAYRGVTAYNSRAVKDKSEGHVFHVITHGKGRMWGHGSLISIEDRWKIAAMCNHFKNNRMKEIFDFNSHKKELTLLICWRK